MLRQVLALTSIFALIYIWISYVTQAKGVTPLGMNFCVATRILSQNQCKKCIRVLVQSWKELSTIESILFQSVITMIIIQLINIAYGTAYLMYELFWNLVDTLEQFLERIWPRQVEQVSQEAQSSLENHSDTDVCAARQPVESAEISLESRISFESKISPESEPEYQSCNESLSLNESSSDENLKSSSTPNLLQDRVVWSRVSVWKKTGRMPRLALRGYARYDRVCKRKVALQFSSHCRMKVMPSEWVLFKHVLV
jgi:hypothetical protein